MVKAFRQRSNSLDIVLRCSISSTRSEKPKKTIKKKPMSTKAKIRREKTLERGMMNAEKDVKRIDKHHEKVTLKKRGKQMWE